MSSCRFLWQQYWWLVRPDSSWSRAACIAYVTVLVPLTFVLLVLFVCLMPILLLVGRLRPRQDDVTLQVILDAQKLWHARSPKRAIWLLGTVIDMLESPSGFKIPKVIEDGDGVYAYGAFSRWHAPVPRLLAYLYECEMAIGNHGEALIVADRALGTWPSDDWIVRKARCLIALGDPSAAVRLLEEHQRREDPDRVISRYLDELTAQGTRPPHGETNSPAAR